MPVEPSAVMIGQRPAGAVRAVQASAEALPFADSSFDVVMADSFWLTAEYLPGFLDLIPGRYRAVGAWQRELEELLGALRLVAAPIPHDCADGFYGAFWRRPTAYLEASVRAGISVFAALDADDVARAVHELDADLREGLWDERHRDLRDRLELHLGYYVAIAELG
jgi:hypothetical protein